MSSTMPSRVFGCDLAIFSFLMPAPGERIKELCQDGSAGGSDMKEKRPLALLSGLWMFYCAVSDSGIVSGTVTGGIGAVVGVVGVICSVSPLPPVPADGLITFMTNAKTIMAIASPQVPFSSISPVRFTPIKLVPPEKPEANPPPFGFWINTKKDSNTLASIINMINNVCIVLFRYGNLFVNSVIRAAKYVLFSGYFKLNFL